MSESAGETTGTGLGAYPLDPRPAVPDALVAARSADWSETGRNGWGYRGDSRSSRIYSRRTSVVVQMNFPGRVKRELHLIYEELLKTPPVVLLILSCLAVLLVGAIVVGATR